MAPEIKVHCDPVALCREFELVSCENMNVSYTQTVDLRHQRI